MTGGADGIRTRLRDVNGTPIYVGDLLYVCEYPDRYVGGSLDYEGIIEIRNGRAVCTYYDIGEEHPTEISFFPVEGRTVADEAARHRYWKTAFFGEEPPEDLWKEERYRAHFAAAYPAAPWKRTAKSC